MSLVTVKGGGLLLPNFFGACRRDITGTGVTIDAAGEKAAFVFRVPKTGTIDRIGFMVRTLTTAQTLRVGLETTDTTNYLPTGTQYGGSTVGTQASPAAGTFYEVILGTPASAVEGDIIAIVVQFDSTVGNLEIGALDNESGGNHSAFPYVAAYTASWAKQAGLVGAFSVRYSDVTYEPIGACIPTAPRADTFFSSSNTPDEIGNRFTLAAPCRVAGVFSGVNHNAAALDYVLYDGTTALGTISVPAGLPAHDQGYGTYYFTTPITLAANTAYRIVVKPTTTTTVNVREAIVLNSAMLDMLPGGNDWYKTSRTDAGAWTDDNTRRIWALGLLIDQIDNAAGSGGGLLVHPGMAGGMRG